MYWYEDIYSLQRNQRNQKNRIYTYKILLKLSKKMQPAQKQAAPQGKKRKQISMELKLEICTNASNLKPSELAAKYEMAPSTIGTIMDNKAKIIDHFNNNLGKSDTKRIRLSNYADIEDALMSWYNAAMKNKSVTIDGPMVQQQALKFAVMLQHPEFKASQGWLDCFKKRQNLSWKSIVGEAGLVDNTTTENYINCILPKLIEPYEPKEFSTLMKQL
jgi:hypothetical protein